MADTTEELAALNDNARILMEKYDGAFTKLDESADEKIVEITTTATTKKTEIEELGTAKKDEILQTADESIETIKDLAEPTKVLSNPVVTLPAKVTAGYSANINLSCESYLINASISEYEITILDEMTIVAATDNVANFTHTFDGAVGDIVSLKVKAKDTLGNYSDTVSVDIELVENMPPSIPTVNGIDEAGVSQNATFSINFTGSTDDDGDSITYKVVDSGAFTFSKITGIAEAESIDVTAPEVTEDTTFSFSVVAVDSNGLESDALVVNVLVIEQIDITIFSYSTPGEKNISSANGKEYAYILIGGGGSGGISHYPGGSSGYVVFGTFTQNSNDDIVINVAGGTPVLENPDDTNSVSYNGVTCSALKGYSSKITYSDGVIKAYGGWGCNTDNVTDGNYDLDSGQLINWVSTEHGFSGGGGAGNSGAGGAGGAGGTNGVDGDTYVGGIGQGVSFADDLVNFAKDIFGIDILFGDVGQPSQGATDGSDGSCEGGGGAAGIVIDGIEPYSIAIDGTANGGDHIPATAGTGFGAGGGAAGYDSKRGNSGAGASGLILLKEI